MEALNLAYKFMTEVTLPINGYDVSIWSLFLFLIVAGFVVWVLREILLG